MLVLITYSKGAPFYDGFRHEKTGVNPPGTLWRLSFGGDVLRSVSNCVDAPKEGAEMNRLCTPYATYCA